MKNLILLIVLSGYSIFCSGQNPDFIYSQTCYGSQTVLSGSSTYIDSDIQSWLWDIDNNGVYDYTGKTVIHTFTSPGNQLVRLKIIPFSGPADSALKDVITDPLPNVNFHVDNLCAYQPAAYYSQSTITSGSLNQFLWDFNNDGTIDDNSNDTVTYTCGPAQVYVTKLTVVSDKGCSSFTTKTTEVFPLPDALFSVGAACAGHDAVFTVTANVLPSEFFIWYFGDGNNTNTYNTTVNHVYTNSGNYDVTLIAATEHGCRDTTTITDVSITPPPVITIQTPSFDTILYTGQSLLLIASGADYYVWGNNLGTGNSITVYQGGVYTVTGTNFIGCTGDASITVTEQQREFGPVVASDILTPNGDWINDFLEIKNISSYNKCSVRVYNIWNDEVFSTINYDNRWNCTQGLDGSLLPDGAYYYIIDCDGGTVKGTINKLSK